MAMGQCLSSLTKNPATVVNDNSYGVTAWGTPANAMTSNNQFATATALILGQKTNYLKATNFGFNIPAAATVCGIEVKFQRTFSGLLGNITDAIVKIVRDGVVEENNYASGTSWSGSNVYVTFGNTTEDWGCTWTPGQINASDFGVVIAANLGGVLVLPSAKVDHIQITVYYSNPLSVKLIDFNAKSNAEGVHLQWKTAAELNNDYFAVERSSNASDWLQVARVQGAGNSNVLNSYEWMDNDVLPGLVYYRLWQFDFDGTAKLIATIGVKTHCFDADDVLTIFPNPVADVLSFNYTATSEFLIKVFVTDLDGKNLGYMQHKVCYGKNYFQMDSSQLPKGKFYLLRIDNGKESVMAKFLK
jgi:hypothetical protein